MKWNPIANAVAAALYILLVGSIIQHLSKLHHDTPDNLLGTMTALSLMTLSAAVMGFLFFGRPAILLLERKHSEAVCFFLKTIGTFAVIALALVFTIS
jgi:hypothetical protein